MTNPISGKVAGGVTELGEGGKTALVAVDDSGRLLTAETSGLAGSAGVFTSFPFVPIRTTNGIVCSVEGHALLTFVDDPTPVETWLQKGYNPLSVVLIDTPAGVAATIENVTYPLIATITP